LAFVGTKLDDLLEWQWPDILAHLKCTKCGSVGWVDPRPNWGEVINYNRGIGAVVGFVRSLESRW